MCKPLSRRHLGDEVFEPIYVMVEAFGGKKAPTVTKSPVRHIAMICVLLGGVVPGAYAQSGVAGSLEQLARIVTPGADITLIDQYGVEFSGFITVLTPRELTMFVDGTPRVFGQNEIFRIHERRNDSLLNGALWGFGTGAGFVLGATIIANIANYYIDESRVAKTVMAFGASGAGVGVLVDALRKSRSVIYEKSTARSSPIDYRFQVTPDRKAVLMVLNF